MVILERVYFPLAVAVCLIACCIQVVSPILAQTVFAESIPIQCHDSPRYLVVARDLRGAAGTDFLIKYKSHADEGLPCEYRVEEGDFEIKNEWAEYFMGLKNDLLFLDSTTGPGPSGLTIWDMKKRKKVFEDSWSSPYEIQDHWMTYWKETEEATNENCPERREWEAHGLGAAIETRVILNFSDFKVTRTTETRCNPRQ
jgi:hypothetical protein